MNGEERINVSISNNLQQSINISEILILMCIVKAQNDTVFHNRKKL